MEIPFIVKARKDTGLNNSKIAIWLFLASEVMLFGGFFSAYVFMRIGADYPWPERTLPVLPGLINTFILIASFVTVVFAWAALKLRKWRQFQIYMGITVACAVIFMCLKAVEYNVKFHHQAVRLNDYTVIEGHLAYKKDKNDNYIYKDGSKIEYNLINIKTKSVTFSSVRFHKPWVEEIIKQAKEQGSKVTLTADYEGQEGYADGAVEKDGKEVKEAKVYHKKGTALSVDLLDEIQKLHIDHKANNQSLRTDNLRQQWRKAKDENPGKRGWQIADKVAVDMEAIQSKLLTEMPAITFTVEPACKLNFKPKDIKEADGSSRLRDDTIITGELIESPMKFHNVDAIDFQYLAMKAIDKGIDPMVAIENSWVIQNYPFAKEAWDWHCGEIAKLEKRLIDDYGYEMVKNSKGEKVPKLDGSGNPIAEREPTFKERYRIGWKELRDKAEGQGGPKLGFIQGTIGEEFTGPNYKARTIESDDKEKEFHTFPELELPREQIAFASKFVPQWNTYYAIYFTITGLHGLHVIGGALVLAYYLFFGRRMYETNPEWLTNRVEVGGLFWHFVDLIWIFAFPIFYLM